MRYLILACLESSRTIAFYALLVVYVTLTYILITIGDDEFIRQDVRRLFYGRFSFYDPNVDKIKEVKQETDIQEKEQKESQRQTNPSTEWKGQSQKNLDTPYPIFGYGVLTNTPYPFLGYGVLAENVFFLIFDQSIIYGVSMAYSSKSGNGLEFFKVFRYDVLDSLAWAPRIKYSKILTQEIGYAVSDFWIRRIDQYVISIFLDTEY
ncbi:hypothetical protein Tco_1407089 [Tanacetum coccineum]